MSRVAYVNGRYLPFFEARIHIEDRGYQFGDGVYEVCEIRNNSLIDERRHLERLQRSLDALAIATPIATAALRFVMRETVRRNRVRDGLVYVQVTRGVARRDHGFPSPAVKPSVVVTARSLDRAKIEATAKDGIAVVTAPDNRWARVDIKTIGLLPNVLARQSAKESGAREAWFVDENGLITEGTSSNAWIVTQDGKLITRPSSHRILTGITLTVLKALAAKEGVTLEERSFSVSEALGAREAFITSATQNAMPVVKIDGQQIGDGKPGAIVQRLREAFHTAAEIGPKMA
jgi:D-alanine transaminase